MFRHGWIFSALVIFVTACGSDSPELPAGEQQEVCSAEGGCEPGFRCVNASCVPEVGGDDAVTQGDITPVDDIAAGPEDTVADDGPALKRVSLR